MAESVLRAGHPWFPVFCPWWGAVGTRSCPLTTIQHQGHEIGATLRHGLEKDFSHFLALHVCVGC